MTSIIMVTLYVGPTQLFWRGGGFSRNICTDALVLKLYLEWLVSIHI